MVINEILISQNFLNYNLKFFIVKVLVKINAHTDARAEIYAQKRTRSHIHTPTGARSCTRTPKRTLSKQKNSRHESAVLIVQNSNEAVYTCINTAPRAALKTYSSCLSLSALSCFITLESKSPKESRSSLIISLSSLSSCSSESAPPINSSSVK